MIVADGEVVGEGWHEGPGTPHAEAMALTAAGELARGATAVVSLEPCSHTGRTSPCTDALIGAGVARVVVGAGDPDARVAGRGVAALRAAGIEVTEGVETDAAEALDPAYFHHRRRGRPLITLKAALTLDGSVAAADGTSQWITGEVARADGHRLRAEVDAVLIGAGTLRTDDPRLTVRLDGYDGPQPRPVVVAGARPLPAGTRLATRNPLVIATTAQPGWETIVVDGTAGHPDMTSVMDALADAGLLHVLVEGGPTLAGALWKAGMVDRGVWYLAGLIGGGAGRSPLGGVFDTLQHARAVHVTDVTALGPDLRVSFEVQ